MDFTQIVILSFIQGFTEFLPISSSAHLILISKLSNWSDQGIIFDIFVHLGTLFAVCFYYKDTLFDIVCDFFKSIKEKKLNANSKLLLGIVIMTIPIGIVGILYQDYIENNLRDIKVIALATIFFAIFLAFADFIYHKRAKIKNDISWLGFLIIGIFQVFALIPGTSRAGIVITLVLILKVSYKMSLKIAFLSAIPVIAMSAILKSTEVLQSNSIDWTSIMIGFIISFALAYISIAFFIRLVEKIGMLPFVYYRLLLGGLLLLI